MFHFRMSTLPSPPQPTAILRLNKTTHDSVFRKVFKEKNCLMSLLNSIYYSDNDDDSITNIQYCSEVTPGVDVHNTKSTTIDIHCETQNGSHFFVEVQLCAMPTDAMFKRFELYSAQLLVDMWRNLPTVRHGYRRYSELQPLHCLVIIDFKITVFENELLSESGVHKFQTFHVPSMKPMSNLHFLQDYTYIYLPKIRELSLHEDESLRSKWFAFLTTGDGVSVNIDEVNDEDVKHAYRVASGVHDAAIEDDCRHEADMSAMAAIEVPVIEKEAQSEASFVSIPVDVLSTIPTTIRDVLKCERRYTSMDARKLLVPLADVPQAYVASLLKISNNYALRLLFQAKVDRLYLTSGPGL